MKRPLLIAAGALALAVPAAAEGPIQSSLGYSFLTYLEEFAGSAPVGLFLSVSGRDGSSADFDVDWHRETTDYYDGASVVLNTFTAAVGLRHGFASSGSVRPFVHVLGGARFGDTYNGWDTAWGGFVGGGVDVKVGKSVAVRLGADFQVFYGENEYTNSLRVCAGLTF